MLRPMKLRGRIYLENNRTLTFHATSFDGTPFQITVDQFDVELNESFTPKKRWVDGWLMVQQEAQQNDIVYITLPKPSITHGHQMSVRDLQLMPRQASIDDFQHKSQALKGTKIPAPSNDEVELDVKVVDAVEAEAKAAVMEEDPFADLPEDEPINLNECKTRCCG